QMPVPIQFIGDDRDTIIIVNHQFSGEQFYVQPGFEVMAIEIDPELWILAEKKVLYDPDTEIDINAITFQPNPTTSKLWVSLRNPSFVAKQYSIINSEGKIIRTVSPPGGSRSSFEIDVSDLAPGVYVLRLLNGNSSKSGSFVVVKQ